MEENYYANGFTYKLKQEDDGWWSIYRWHEFRQEYVPIIQAKNLQKAKEYCEFCEPKVVPMKKI